MNTYPLILDFKGQPAAAPDLIQIPNNSSLTGHFTERNVPSSTCGQTGNMFRKLLTILSSGSGIILLYWQMRLPRDLFQISGLQTMPGRLKKYRKYGSSSVHH
jgi:hypothetical protein